MALDQDQELMLRVRDGDAVAFEALYRRHARPVLNFAYRMLGRRHRAEEIAQDVFLKLYNARASYEPTARFTTYLYRIATNACLNDQARVEHQTVRRSLDQPIGGEEDGPIFELADADARGADEHLARRDRGARVQAALGALTETQRAALVLREYDDLSYEEIAASLETTVSAVKGLIHRAREALKEELKDLL